MSPPLPAAVPTQPESGDLADASSPATSPSSGCPEQPVPTTLSCPLRRQNATRKRPMRTYVPRLNLAGVVRGDVPQPTVSDVVGPCEESGSEGPSSPSVYSTGSASDEENSNSSRASSVSSQLKAPDAKRTRFESSTSTSSASSTGSSGCLSDSALYGDESPSQSVVDARNHKGNRIIGDGEYELISDGSSLLAHETATGQVFQAKKLSPDDYRKFKSVAVRINKARSNYCRGDFARLKNMIIPEYTRLVPHHRETFLLMPVYTRTFDSVYKEQLMQFTERRLQPIIRQLVELLEFCHSVNLLLRDFRLKKFVFMDEELTQLRLYSALELNVVDLEDDSLTQKKDSSIPFLSPEMLSHRPSYAGKPADVWALGVLMHMLISGKYPFSAGDPQTLVQAILNRNFTYKLDVGASLAVRWMIFGVLRTNPAERPTATRLKYSHWLRMKPEELANDRDRNGPGFVSAMMVGRGSRLSYRTFMQQSISSNRLMGSTYLGVWPCVPQLLRDEQVVPDQDGPRRCPKPPVHT